MASLDAGGADVAIGISAISRIKSSTGTGNCGSRCNKIEGLNRGLAVSDVSSGWCLRLGPLISRE